MIMMVAPARAGGKKPAGGAKPQADGAAAAPEAADKA
jgi:translation initiation factor IF-3